jgi:hypothetical protein
MPFLDNINLENLRHVNKRYKYGEIRLSSAQGHLHTGSILYGTSKQGVSWSRARNTGSAFPTVMVAPAIVKQLRRLPVYIQFPLNGLLALTSLYAELLCYQTLCVWPLGALR